MQRSGGEQMALRRGKRGLLPVLPRRLSGPWPCKPDVRSQGAVECSAVSFIFTVFFQW